MLISEIVNGLCEELSAILITYKRFPGRWRSTSNHLYVTALKYPNMEAVMGDQNSFNATVSGMSTELEYDLITIYSLIIHRADNDSLDKLFNLWSDAGSLYYPEEDRKSAKALILRRYRDNPHFLVLKLINIIASYSNELTNEMVKTT